MKTSQCDQSRIDKFLNDNSLNVDIQIIRHLDTCESCRKYLDDQAAQPIQWQEAHQMLQPTEFKLASSVAFLPNLLGDRKAQHASSVQAVLDSLTPSDNPHRLGRIGTYEISGVIGAGGMGVVLKAIDPSLDRVVAIKVLAPHLAHNATSRKRFAREAKAAAAVLHPNVIPIHSVASEGQPPCLVMSYVRGGSLQKRLQIEGPLASLEILRIGSQIAAGLAAAHEQGLVHRDVKPANILLEEGVERVTLTDFGLARAVDDASVTHEGTIAGTPQYMSPEQARGESVDQQSDLFSLGSVLYALCCGRPPFRAATSIGVMRQICDAMPISIQELNPKIPEWLGAIVDKLMAKEKAARFESATEVNVLLEMCLSHLQQPTSTDVPRHVLLRCNTERRPKSRFPSMSKLYNPVGKFTMSKILLTGIVSLILCSTTAWYSSLGSIGNNQSEDKVDKSVFVEALKVASEDTQYAPGYTEKTFKAIKIGDLIENVENKLGKPFSVTQATPYIAWLYAPDKHPEFTAHGRYPTMDRACNIFTFDEQGEFVSHYGQEEGTSRMDGDNKLVVSGGFSSDGHNAGPLEISRKLVQKLKQQKATTEQIHKQFAEPQEKYESCATKWLVYSRSPSGGDYRKRVMGIDKLGKVCEIVSEFYWD